MTVRLSEEDKINIAYAYQELGKTADEIAADMGFSVFVVRKVLRNDPTVLMRSGGPQSKLEDLTQNRWDEMVRRYHKGEDVDRLAHELGVERETFQYWMRKMEITPKTQTVEYQFIRKAKLEKAVQMYQQGWQLAFISEALEISQLPIYTELNRRGVPLRGQGVPGSKPVRDKQTGQPIVDEEGNYVPQDVRGRRAYVRFKNAADAEAEANEAREFRGERPGPDSHVGLGGVVGDDPDEV